MEEINQLEAQLVQLEYTVTSLMDPYSTLLRPDVLYQSSICPPRLSEVRRAPRRAPMVTLELLQDHTYDLGCAEEVTARKAGLFTDWPSLWEHPRESMDNYCAHYSRKADGFLGPLCLEKGTFELTSTLNDVIYGASSRAHHNHLRQAIWSLGCRATTLLQVEVEKHKRLTDTPGHQAYRDTVISLWEKYRQSAKSSTLDPVISRRLQSTRTGIFSSCIGK